MGKFQPDKLFINNSIPCVLKKQQEVCLEVPPQIPPRMKKKGPELPEKPPHLRAKSTTVQSSHSPREPLKPRILNLDKPFCPEREVLVAASKAVRERPVEKRQREPAKLLLPNNSVVIKKDQALPSILLDNVIHKKDLSILPSKGPIRLEDCIPPKKELSIYSSKNWPLDDSLSSKKSDKNSVARKSRPIQPVLLIPRSLLTWGSTPISYALWTQRDAGRGVVKPIKPGPVRQPKTETSDTSAVFVRSGSVVRSGSLTSQGSSSSDSGGETFPKSVLKKQKRITANNIASKNTSNRKVEQKKNVTFNAFATVQLMEE